MKEETGRLDEDFLIEHIGHKLQRRLSEKIIILDENMHVDYRIIFIDSPMAGVENPEKSRLPIVLVTGFGSGWTGISELGFYLAIKGWRVVLVSLPGYGDSDDPDEYYYDYDKDEGFPHEASVLAQFVRRALHREKVHWVEHSMGAAIIAQVAQESPSQVASLTLLNPAGFEHVEDKLKLAIKFVLSGILHRLSPSKKSVWKRLLPYLPKEKSPFARERLSQRISEWKRICDGASLNVLAKVARSVPVAYISGKKDFVFPSRHSAILNRKLLAPRVNMVRILPLGHNTTMFGSDMTAEAINEFLVRLG